MREQVPHGRAGRAGGLVEVDDPLLRRDEHGHRGGELRDRRPGVKALHVAENRLDARRSPRPPRCAHGHASTCRKASIASTLSAWSGSSSPPERRSRIASATRAPCASGARSGSPARRRSCPATPTRPTTPTSRRSICIGIIERALAEAGATLRRRRAHPDLRHARRGHRRRRPRPPRRLRHGTPGDDRHRRRAARPALARRDRGRGGDRVSDARSPACIDHKFGAGDPYTIGVEEEFMLLDPETWDLVQHIEAVLAKAAEGEFADARALRADAVGGRDHDAGLPHGGRGGRAAAAAARARGRGRAHRGRALRVRRARIPSACSSASGSRRRTATAGSSSRCSTSPGAS